MLETLEKYLNPVVVHQANVLVSISNQSKPIQTININIMTQVIIKVVEAPESLPIVIDATEQDLFHITMLALKVYSSLPKDVEGKDQFGNGIPLWSFRYPTVDDVLVDGESLRLAVQQHGPNMPIILKTNYRAGYGQRIRRYLTSTSVNSRGRPIRNYFEFNRGVERVTPDMPYVSPIVFGQHLSGGCRDIREHPMDSQVIKLDTFNPRFRTQYVATLVAMIYAAIYGPSNGAGHPLRRFIQGKTFSKAYCRVADFSRTNNVVTGDTQAGKSKEITVSAIMSLFLGRDALVYVRNNGGTQPKETFRKDMKDFVSLVKNFAEEVLEVSFATCEGLFESINLYTESTGRTNFQRPLIYVDRTNPTRLNYPVKHIYPECSRDKYNLLIDEIDEQQSSKDGTRGKTENLLFNVTQQTAEDKTIFSNAHLMMGFTATPYATLSVKPIVENEEYSNNVIQMPIPSDYKGYNPALPEDRKIVITETPEKVSKSTIPNHRSLPFIEVLLRTDKGIQMMLNHMKSIYSNEGYVSGLVTCSTIHHNVNKRNASQGLVGLTSDVPSTAFSHDQEGDKHIYFSEWFKIEGLDLSCIASLGGHPVTIRDNVIEVKLPKELRTVHVMYDICIAFYKHVSEVLGFHVEPFMICNSLTLANRGITFKTSDHKYPLTHMYASTKSKNCKYAMDIKQIAGRLCSRDSLSRKRYLFATLDFINHLFEAYKVDAEVLATYSSGPRNFTATIDALPETGTVAKNAHFESGQLRLLKKRHAEEVADEIADRKVKRHRHEYYPDEVPQQGISISTEPLEGQEQAVMSMIEDLGHDMGWFTAAQIYNQLVSAELIVPRNFQDTSRPFFRSGGRPDSIRGEIVRALRSLARKTLILENATTTPFRFHVL